MAIAAIRSEVSRLALFAALCAVALTAEASIISVNDIGDTEGNDGKCTLREAMKAANNNAASGGAAGECAAGQVAPTVDSIQFAIPGDVLHTITLTSELPTISEVVTIDGYTQTGSSKNTLPVGDNAVLHIEVSGAGLAAFTDTFRIAANGTTMRGLLVSHTRNQAFYVGPTSPVTGVIVEGNFIGTDASGTAVTAADNINLIRLIGNANRLGGTTAAARNVIAGGGNTVIYVAGTGNLIQGNYVGVTASGTQALPPAPAANATTAIELGPYGAANGTVIGGASPDAGNVITGTSYAINLGSNVHDTVIQNNHIGVDATGTRAVGGSIGISTNNGPTGTIIGGVDAGNLIFGLSRGIYLNDGAAGTIIKGNRIGSDVTGTKLLANNGSGIYIQTQSAGSVIGGTGLGEGNTIAFNCGYGVGMWPDTYVGWKILGNSIFSNNGLGIALANGVPAVNDAGDGDTGPNNLQNHPVITAAPVVAGVVNFAAVLNSEANKTYRVEFFSGLGCHASGSGEGRHFLGSIDAHTNASGDASIASGSAMFSVPVGHSIFTATATDPDGNTSEFAQCVGIPELLFHSDFDGACAGYD